MTYDELRKVVQDYFGDTSRPASETKADLLALADECETMADTIKDEGQ